MNGRQIEMTGEKDFGLCACCGGTSRTVWGLVRRGGAAEAAYYVHWTVGHVPEHGAYVDLIIGRWGEGTSRGDRSAISLQFRRIADRPEFTVIDAMDRAVAKNELVGKGLARGEVIGTILAPQVFDIVDAIWLSDSRIEEITEKPDHTPDGNRQPVDGSPRPSV